MGRAARRWFQSRSPIYFETHEFTLSVYLDGRLTEVHTGLAFTDDNDCADTDHQVRRRKRSSTGVEVDHLTIYTRRRCMRIGCPRRRPPRPADHGVDGLTNLITDDFTGDPGVGTTLGTADARTGRRSRHRRHPGHQHPARGANAATRRCQSRRLTAASNPARRPARRSYQRRRKCRPSSHAARFSPSSKRW